MNPGQGITVNMADVGVKSVQWLWADYVPIGKLSILEGHADRGKSTAVLDIAARVTRGLPMPDSSKGKKGGVVILSAEDDLSDTLRPRLEAAGADLSRIEVLVGVKGKGPTAVSPTLMDLSAIEDAVKQVRARLLIVDTLADFFGAASLGNAQTVRTILLPLGQLASRLRLAVLLVRHFTKTGKTLTSRGMGSHAVLAVSRSAMFIDRDPDREGRLILAVFKSNLAAIRPSSLAFGFVSDTGTVKIEWHGRSDWTAEALCAATNESEKAGGMRRVAQRFLEAALEAGPRSSKEITDEANARGISTRTLERARKGLKLKPVKTPDGWQLIAGGESKTAKEEVAVLKDEKE